MAALYAFPELRVGADIGVEPNKRPSFHRTNFPVTSFARVLVTGPTERIAAADRRALPKDVCGDAKNKPRPVIGRGLTGLFGSRRPADSGRLRTGLGQVRLSRLRRFIDGYEHKLIAALGPGDLDGLAGLE